MAEAYLEWFRRRGLKVLLDVDGGNEEEDRRIILYRTREGFYGLTHPNQFMLEHNPIPEDFLTKARDGLYRHPRPGDYYSHGWGICLFQTAERLLRHLRQLTDREALFCGPKIAPSSWSRQKPPVSKERRRNVEPERERDPYESEWAIAEGIGVILVLILLATAVQHPLEVAW